MLSLGSITGVHHIAFAESGPNDALTALQSVLGLSMVHEEVADGFVERMLDAGNCYIQTLEATGPGTVQRFVAKRGSALHHIAFSVTDIDVVLASLERDGCPLIDTQPRRGGMGTRIAFLHPAALGGLLVELVEVPGWRPTERPGMNRHQD